jgi:hypothetical protein
VTSNVSGNSTATTVNLTGTPYPTGSSNSAVPAPDACQPVRAMVRESSIHWP